jgi:hypothetical protein
MTTGQLVASQQINSRNMAIALIAPRKAVLSVIAWFRQLTSAMGPLANRNTRIYGITWNGTLLVRTPVGVVTVT